jgi:hypothetical protein
MTYLQKYIHIGKRRNLNWIQAHVFFVLSTFSVPLSNSTNAMKCTFDVQRILAKIHLRLYPVNVLQAERDRKAFIQKKRKGIPLALHLWTQNVFVKLKLVSILRTFSQQPFILSVCRCYVYENIRQAFAIQFFAPSGPVPPLCRGFTITLKSQHNR